MTSNVSQLADRRRKQGSGSPHPGIRELRGRCQISYNHRGRRIQELLKIPFTEEGVMRAALVRHERIQYLKHGPPIVSQKPVTFSEMFKSARKRGSLLTPAEEDFLVQRSGGKCEMTGIEFSMARTGFRAPFAPSLDRIDCAQKYEVGNCRLVCIAVNLAMNEWGEDVFRRIVLGYINHKLVLT